MIQTVISETVIQLLLQTRTNIDTLKNLNLLSTGLKKTVCDVGSVTQHQRDFSNFNRFSQASLVKYLHIWAHVRTRARAEEHTHTHI